MAETMTGIEELTAEQAATVLNVPLAYLHDLLQSGAIRSRRVGDECYASPDDIATYQRAVEQVRLKALAELSALDQELGFGY